MIVFRRKRRITLKWVRSFIIFSWGFGVVLSSQKLSASGLLNPTFDVCDHLLLKIHKASQPPSLVELTQDQARLRDFRASQQTRERFLELNLDSVFYAKGHPDIEYKSVRDLIGAENFSSTPTSDLTPDEEIAIHRYSVDGYWQINNGLRLNNPKLSDDINTVALMILSGLNKLPSWQGVTYRRVPADSNTDNFIRSLQFGSVIQDPAFVSTSPDLSDVTGHDGFILRIHSKTGVEITDLADGQENREILFRPNTSFLVFNRSVEILPDVGEVLVIDLYEMPEETAPESDKTSEKTEEVKTTEVSSTTLTPLPERDIIFSNDYVVTPSVTEKIIVRKKASLGSFLETLAEKFPAIARNQSAADAVVAAFLMDRKLEDTAINSDFIKTKLKKLQDAGLEPEVVKRLFEEGLIGSLFENSSPSSPQETSQSAHSPAEPVFSSSPRRPLSSGWQTDSTNRRFYLKEDRGVPEGQTAAEVITSEVYRRLGYETPATYIIYQDGKRYSASQEIVGQSEQSDLTGFNSKKFRALRFFAAYLKDWDRLQIGADGNGNNFDLGGKKFAMIDFGGSLGFRAMGESKPSLFTFPNLPEVGGFELTRNPDILMAGFDLSNIESDDHPWKNLSREDYEFALKQFRKLLDKDIIEIVKSAKYSNPNAEIYMIDALITRRDGFIQLLESLIR